MENKNLSNIKGIPWPNVANAIQRKPFSQGWLRTFAAWRGTKHEPAAEDFFTRPPLILGVSGHRALPIHDHPALRSSVAETVAALQRACPGVPVILLSALAEGADRLVAEAVLELPNTRLMVPLPLPLEQYRQTFLHPDDPAFDALCAKAAAVFPIPVPAAEVLPLFSGVPDDSPACYEALGVYLLQHCHMLLALWDGQGAAGAGGTAQVTYSWLSGTWQPQDAHDTQSFVPDGASGRPCIHIQVNRQGHSPAYGTPGNAVLLRPEGMSHAKALAFMDSMCSRLRAYPAPSSASAQSDPLYGGTLTEPVPTDAVDDFTHALYEAVNVRAVYYAGKLRSQICQITWGGFVALLCFHAYRHGLSWGLPMSAVLSALLAYGFCVAKWGDWAKRHLTYRAYAEALRIQSYWRLCGIPATVTQEMLRPQAQDWAAEVHWLAMDTACVALAADATQTLFTPQELSQRQKAAQAAWLHGQHRYFVQKARANRHENKKYQRWITSMFVLGGVLLLNVKVLSLSKSTLSTNTADWLQWPSLLVLLGVAALSSFSYLVTQLGLLNVAQKAGVFFSVYVLPTVILWLMGHVPMSTEVAEYLTTIYGILLTGAAAAGGYAHMNAFQANTVRYTQYSYLYQNALMQLQRTDSPTLQHNILLRLGKKSLAENAIWYRQHIERPLRLPSL